MKWSDNKQIAGGIILKEVLEYGYAWYKPAQDPMEILVDEAEDIIEVFWHHLHIANIAPL